MPRAAFLDRDGTIIDDPGYLADPEGVRLLPRAADAIAALADAGYLIVIVTNQSGLARGLFSEDTLAAIHQRLRLRLRDAHPAARIDAIYHCPHLPPDPGQPETPLRRACPCRKPAPGMLLRAAAEHNIDLAASVTIGDSPRDVEAGQAAGCGAALLLRPALPTLYDAVLNFLRPHVL